MEEEMRILRNSLGAGETLGKGFMVNNESPLDQSSSSQTLSQSSLYQATSPLRSVSDLPSPVYVTREATVGAGNFKVKKYGFPSSMRDQYSVKDFECEAKSIDGFTLKSDTIKNLFKEFLDNYHPYLPVVDISMGPEKIYSVCPPLFWTIMAVASRRYYRDSELMLQLAHILKACLADITISPVTRFAGGDAPRIFFNMASVYTVQAFLISTMWPPLTSSISADSSWNTAGIAMVSATRVGLHCPGYSRDFSRVKADNPLLNTKISEQVRTWACCNVVAQTLAGMYGFPSYTNFDSTVNIACRPSSGLELPSCLRHMTIIQRLENEIEKALNSNYKDPLGLSELSERLSLIQIMSDKLDEVEMSISSELDDFRKFELLTCRLHLTSYYFLDNSGFTTWQLQKGFVQAYNSALALLEHTDESCKRDKGFIRYIPNVNVMILWQASIIINRVYHSKFSSYVDTKTGKELYQESMKHISRASILKHDMAYRAAEVMQQMWQLFEEANMQKKLSSVKVSIRTRMSASIFFDCLWLLREETGIRSAAPPVLNQRISDDDENDTDNNSSGLISRGGASSVSNSTDQLRSSVTAAGVPEPIVASQELPRNKRETESFESQSSSQPILASSVTNSVDNNAEPASQNNMDAHNAVTDTNIMTDHKNSISLKDTNIPKNFNYSKDAADYRNTYDTTKGPSNSLYSTDSLYTANPKGTVDLTFVSMYTSNPKNTTDLKALPTSKESRDPLLATANVDNLADTNRLVKLTDPDASGDIEGVIDWHVDHIWRDVDLMMNGFGFHQEEVPFDF